MRQLATIQKIKEIENIEGKDLIGLASFEDIGWKVIVSKTECKPGDIVVYFEVDSMLPIKEEYEFLRSRTYNSKFNRFRIKTMKMGQVWSEGLAIPAQNLGFNVLAELVIGEDLTDKLDIKEYGALAEVQDKETNARVKQPRNPILKFLFKFYWFRQITKWYFIKDSNISTSWSALIPIGKTDETRIQNLSYLFDAEKSPLINKTLVSTVKVDGSSVTLSYNAKKKKLNIASRNQVFIDAKDSNNWTDTIKKLGWDKAIVEYCKEANIDKAIFQGELLGPGIQKNRYNLKHHTIIWFNLYVEAKGESKGRYLTYDEMVLELEYIRKLKTCNILSTDNKYFSGYNPVKLHSKINFDIDVHTLKWFEDESIGIDEDLTNFHREGLVWRSADNISLQNACNGMSNMLSFKVINKEWQLKTQNEKE